MGVVIPPSIVLVVYGIYTGQSIAKLFFGSIIPGLVMGGLFVGFFTPSEAGAVGSFCALFLSLFRRSLSYEKFLTAINDTLKISSFIIIIIAGAVIFGRYTQKIILRILYICLR